MLLERAAPAPRRRRRRGLVAAVAAIVLVLLAGGLAVAAGTWSHAGLTTDEDALARLTSPRFAASVQSVRAFDEHDHAIALENRGGRLYPTHKVAAGERITVVARSRRPGWSAWALGDSETTKLVVRTPTASVADRWPRVKAGQPLRVRFDTPVRTVALSTRGRDRHIVLRHGAHAVDVGAQPPTGSLTIAAAPRTWERLARAATVTWFPTGRSPQAIVTPAHGSTFTPTTRITVTYSRKPKAMPTLSVNGHGAWSSVDAHTVRYVPRGAGFGLGAHVELRLPAGARVAAAAAAGSSTAADDPLPDGVAASWTVPPGSIARLQQLLADQGYLPVAFTPSGAPVRRIAAAQERAAVDPPAGTFAWKDDNVPGALRDLWTPGSENEITHGALMAFQSDHGLTVDGLAGPSVWQAIIAAEIAGKQSAAGYSYVLVHRDVPQSLTLWHDGRTLLKTPANTGVPAAPTKLGTFPVYERLASQTMTGTNPDGSTYSDPGIKWISYFNGGDAIHGFERGSYGTPQSVGCVELPVPAAAKVWPHTPIGTLVTVAH